MTSSKYEQNEKKSVESEMVITLENLRAAKEKKLENIESLAKDSEQITDKIQNMEKSFTEFIQNLRQSAVDALKTRQDETRRTIESDASSIADMIEKLEKVMKLSETAKDMDSVNGFVLLKMMAKIVADAKQLHNEKNQSCSGLSLSFKEDEGLDALLKRITSLGEIIEMDRDRASTARGQFKVKSVKEISIKAASSSTYGNILDACQLPDGTVTLADCNNKNILCLDANYNVRYYRAVESPPTAPCCVGPDTIAVKMANNKLQVFSVKSVLSIQGSMSIGGGRFCGLAYCSYKLWVSTGKTGVRIYSTAGKRLNCLDACCFKGETRHIAEDGSTVYVTDSSDGVVCFNSDGNVLKELRDSRLKSTYGVCVSPDGTVFLSGLESGNIVMFSRDGECLGELVKDLQSPVSLCFNKKQNKLIATSLHGKITVIDFCE